MAGQAWQGVTVYTVGHSTRTLDELVELLHAFAIATLADVRAIPRSRHNPQFNRDVLPTELARHGIGYVHIPRLGGLRRSAKRSTTTNTGWRNASFRGFADYMSTDEFEAGLVDLHECCDRGPVALMCAEAVPWRCHRSLIADALLARGARVDHISGVGRAKAHRLTPFAQVDAGRVTYPAPGAG
jgi:uncharacterized protein (DUF488 family)